MTWVKVCGLTHPDDVAVAVAAGADAIGFVTAAESPRRVTPEDAARLGSGLTATRVLVTVDLEPQELLDAAGRAGVDGVQPGGRHGAAAAAAAATAGYLVLRPVAVGTTIDLDDVPPEQTPLLDTAVPGRHGGTGETFDWSLAAGVGRPVVLAGGLGPDNVAAAVTAVRPWGVDASSRLEQVPGRKDPHLVRRFVAAAKAT